MGGRIPYRYKADEEVTAQRKAILAETIFGNAGPLRRNGDSLRENGLGIVIFFEGAREIRHHDKVRIVEMWHRIFGSLRDQIARKYSV